ncbi:hypothetical protein RJP56_16540 [Shewanella baltica]|uniref:hypothetical protein n=2 Tax=Shewanella TaxID=22 RepID=UPI0028727197|nr:hypothetical protein [Shewanella baltica]MDR9767671.1 hypothetical protein [Shewanella baltica]
MKNFKINANHFSTLKESPKAKRLRQQHCCSCGCFITAEQRNETNACAKCAAEMAYIFTTPEQMAAIIIAESEQPQEDFDDEPF